MSVHANKSKATGKITSYTVRYRDHNGVQQRSRPFRGKSALSEAKAYDAEVSVAKAKGRSTDALLSRAQTLRAVAEQLATTTAPDLKPSTRSGDDSAYRIHIYPLLGDRPINAISTMEVQSWYNDLRAKVSERTGRSLSASTVHNTYVTLSKTFDFALRLDLISVNPCKAIVRAKTSRKKRAYLDRSQVKMLGRVLDDAAPYGLILRAAAFTGLRSGELAALTIGDVTHRGEVAAFVEVHQQIDRSQRDENGWGTMSTKTDAGERRVPIGALLREELTVYLAQHPRRHDPSAPLWPGRRRGTKGDPRGLDYDLAFDIESLKCNYFKPALKRLGLEGFAWHDLRHFYASVLIATKKFSMEEISAWMGHASYATTVDRYGHLLDPDYDMSAFDAFMDADDSNVTPLRPRATSVG